MYKFQSIVSVKSFGDGIKFTDGSTVHDHHNQSCCEDVYADFDALSDTLFAKSSFNVISFEIVPSTGVRIYYGMEGEAMNSDLLPCYSKQNGYYSDNLELIIKIIGNESDTIDIEDATNQQYY